MAEPSSTLRRRLLGRELRRLREAAGMTLIQAAAQVDRTDGTLSRVENGRLPIRPIEVKNLLDTYGVADDRRRETLLALARDARKRGWWQTYADMVTPSYLDFIGLESDAARLSTFQNTLVHGLLQVEDYARAVIRAGQPDAPSEEIDSLVEVRLARQSVLTRENPLDLHMILTQAVLDEQVGGRGVMQRQLQRLVETSDLPNVTVQVLPRTVGAHIGMWGLFDIIRFPEPAPIEVVALENMTGILYLEEDIEVDLYRRAFDRLQKAALSPADSRAMITRMCAAP